MFKFITGTISIGIQKIKDWVHREDNFTNEDVSVDESVANENVTSTDSKHVQNLPEEQPAVVDEKCKEPLDIASEKESESEIIVVYDKLRKDRLKRSFKYAFPEEEVQEEFESLVKKIKLNYATQAAALLFKHNVRDSVICEALDLDETMLQNLKDIKEESESNFNVEPPIIEVENKRNVLKEKNQDVRNDVKDIKECFVQLEHVKLDDAKETKYYIRKIELRSHQNKMKLPKSLRF